MQRRGLLAFILCTLLILVLSTASLTMAQEATEEAPVESTEEAPVESTEEAPVEPTEEPAGTAEPSGTVYTVLPGDNLFRIALRFGTSVAALAAENGIVNPGLILVGQQIRIPGEQGDTGDSAPPAGPAETPEPSPTEEPAMTGTYVVQPGDTLFRIALRNRTTVTSLAELNNIANRNLIFVGQTLNIPGGQPAADTGEETPSDTDMADTTDEVDEVPAPTISDPGFDYGIEVYVGGQDVATLVSQVEQLGMAWVKIEVNWRDIEPIQGEIDYAALDQAVNTLNTSGLNILFTVSTAPQWARSSNREDGPPDDFAHFAAFAGTLAQRYAGRVDAYEIWNEPNLRREWNSSAHSIDAGAYMELMSAARDAIKAADPNASVISAGLAPTGFNDGVNAIDDRVFLQDMYSNDLASVADAIGAHPGGWANPPDATCCDQPEGVETHFDDRSFFFQDTLNDYRQIMIRNSDSETPIWVTRFGWGSTEDSTAARTINVFYNYTSLAEQATYVPRGFELGNEMGFVGPMFVFNLNGCQGQPDRAEFCYHSLVGPSGATRPVFDSVQAAEKSSASGDSDTSG
jgi:LysM repeat protein